MSGIYPVGVLPVGVGDDFEFGQSGQIIDIARATDAGSARTLSAPRTVAIIRSTETDSSRGVVAPRAVAIVRSAEASSARILTAGNARVVEINRGTESNSARAIAVGQPTVVNIVRSQESNSARVVVSQRSIRDQTFIAILEQVEAKTSETITLSVDEVGYSDQADVFGYAVSNDEVTFSQQEDSIAA